MSIEEMILKFCTSMYAKTGKRVLEIVLDVNQFDQLLSEFRSKTVITESTTWTDMMSPRMDVATLYTPVGPVKIKRKEEAP